jgi:primosomal protein N' (replication factor Y)
LQDALKADVAVPIPIDKTLTYAVPGEMGEALRVGMRVAVPVKTRLVAGVVVSLGRVGPEGSKLRPIKGIVDEVSVITPPLMNLAGWMSDYYIAPLGEVLAAISPPHSGFRQVVRLVSPPGDLEMEVLRATSPVKAEIIEALESGRPLGLDTLRRKMTSEDVYRSIEDLEKEGVLATEVMPRRSRMPKSRVAGGARTRADAGFDGAGGARASGARVCGRTGPEGPAPSPYELTPHQQRAFESIKAAAGAGEFKTFLLHGVTGSGKTEVYLRAIDEVVKSGRKAIYLVPEIGLTPQVLARVRNYFGDRCALLHSRVSPRERYRTWLDAIAGNVDVVVGARSAVFAPFEDVGIIVVDEEHDSSYKQQDSPRYNAREVALMRGRSEGAVVILGSATPRLETYFNAVSGKYELFEMPERIAGGLLPEVDIVDMRTVQGRSIISPQAEAAIEEALGRGEQVVLFLNRRGFANFVQCRDCGFVPRCLNCHVTLTYHIRRKELKCHYCDYTEGGMDSCPKCGGASMEFVGAGTQKIEDYINSRFPGAVAARFDSDSTRLKGSAEHLLTDFDSGLVSMLVGTQMVAKGHDFKGVGLVVVVNADVSMNLPDFRAGERTFQILTQVAGRAGRGNFPGRVIIQTFNPEHHALHFAAGHDFKGFFAEEVEIREELSYPPFARLVRVVAESRAQESARRAAEKFAGLARKLARDSGSGVEVLGPSRAPIPRLKNVQRWHLILKGSRTRDIPAFVSTCLETYRRNAGREQVRFGIDVDPENMI